MPKTKNKTLAKYSKEKSIRRESEVLDAISKMVENGEKISFYSVSKKTGASKSYLYKNKNIFNTIDKCRNTAFINSFVSKNDDNIESLKKKINKLEKENASLIKYRDLYLKTNEENLQLKKQLKSAYSYSKSEDK